MTKRWTSLAEHLPLTLASPMGKGTFQEHASRTAGVMARRPISRIA
jgi:hypothetical protein